MDKYKLTITYFDGNEIKVENVTKIKKETNFDPQEAFDLIRINLSLKKDIHLFGENFQRIISGTNIRDINIEKM